MKRCIILFVFCALLQGLQRVHADNLSLSPLFSDGAVLQQKSLVPIFGNTQPGNTVLVSGSWDGKRVAVRADSTGRFVAYLKTPPAGGPYTLHVNDRVIEDVLIGEVWLCSGQSNMQFRLSESDMREVAHETNDNIRVFTVPVRSAETPQRDLDAGYWIHGNTDTTKMKISAVGYYFARRLQRELGVPVGMISSARGATGAEEWMSRQTFESIPEEEQALYKPTREKWVACWYNAMIYPLLPYAIRGAIWYQGENNSSRPKSYRTLMKGLVSQWRDEFENPRMPFYIVQLTSFKKNWAGFREIQQQIADEIPHCGFVPTIDVGNEKNIHPKNKFPVGERLAELALANDYRIKECRKEAPRFRSMKVKGDTAVIAFENAEEGLILKQGDSPLYFEICGADGKFFPAEARLQDNKVYLVSDAVPEPAGARYFWRGYGEPNLFSADGWPVAPFRTE